MEKQEKGVQQVNLRVKDADQFYANETSINFGPLEFTLDFKCMSHVQDIADHGAMILKHNIVILTPYHIKSFAEVLSKSVKDYESKFGNIKKPVELEKAEKMVKKEQKKIDKKEEKENDNNSSYFG